MEAGSSWRVRIAAPHIPHVPYVFEYSIIKVHSPTCVDGQKTLCLFWIKSFLDLPAQKAHKHSPSAMNGSVKIMCFSGMASLQFQFIGAVFLFDLFSPAVFYWLSSYRLLKSLVDKIKTSSTDTQTAMSRNRATLPCSGCGSFLFAKAAPKAEYPKGFTKAGAETPICVVRRSPKLAQHANSLRVICHE